MIKAVEGLKYNQQTIDPSIEESDVMRIFKQFSVFT